MSGRKSALREYYEAILVAFILALFVRTFVFENFKIRRIHDEASETCAPASRDDGRSEALP